MKRIRQSSTSITSLLFNRERKPHGLFFANISICNDDQPFVRECGVVMVVRSAVFFLLQDNCMYWFRKHEDINCDKQFAHDMLLVSLLLVLNFKNKNGVMCGFIDTGS